jgi:hypothetical protein
MKYVLLIIGMLCGLFMGGCATIPPEAPELSVQLGLRISAVESAHNRLLEDFFAEKRRQIDHYVQEVWVPVFTREFFSDPKVSDMWGQVVQSQDPGDRIKFMTLVGPRLQDKINRKRLELIQPLDELERIIKAKLKAEYDNMRAINNSLTAYLQSAVKVEENRRRYLAMLGLSEKGLDTFVDDTDKAVDTLVGTAHTMEDHVKNAEKFKETVSAIIETLRK